MAGYIFYKLFSISQAHRITDSVLPGRLSTFSTMTYSRPDRFGDFTDQGFCMLDFQVNYEWNMFKISRDGSSTCKGLIN